MTMSKFSDIVGHDEVIKHIKNAYVAGKVSHAYIIEGDEGMGKGTLSKTFAKLLQCEKVGVENEPCGICPACRQVESNNHPDIIYVHPSKKTGYGVADIREQVIKDIHIKPYKGPYKIYIIHEADEMTIQAQNSILKTIEEPPNYGVFFLLAKNSNSFLQTILSRAIKISLKPISDREVERYLMGKMNMLYEDAKVLSAFSRGNIGKAMQLKNDTEFLAIRQDMIKLLEAFIKAKEYDIMERVKLLDRHKDKFQTVFEILISLIRDILYYKSTNDIEYLIHQDKKEVIMELSTHANEKKLIKLVENCQQMSKQIRLNVNYTLASLVMVTDV